MHDMHLKNVLHGPHNGISALVQKGVQESGSSAPRKISPSHTLQIAGKCVLSFVM